MMVIVTLVVFVGIAYAVGLSYWIQRSYLISGSALIIGNWLLMNVCFHYYYALKTSPGHPPDVSWILLFQVMIADDDFW